MKERLRDRLRDAIGHMDDVGAWPLTPGQLYPRECCACGLTHVEQVLVKEDKVLLHAAVDESATERNRGEMSLADWRGLRRVCDAHILRLLARGKE